MEVKSGIIQIWLNNIEQGFEYQIRWEDFLKLHLLIIEIMETKYSTTWLGVYLMCLSYLLRIRWFFFLYFKI